LKENERPSNQDTTPAKEIYKATLSEVIFGSPKVASEAKILHFKPIDGTFKKSESSPIRLNAAELQFSPRSSPTTSPVKRKVSTVPERILDAPDILDDYYLNLMDWSVTNNLAIALSSAVYIWNGEDKKSYELCSTREETNRVSKRSIGDRFEILLEIVIQSQYCSGLSTQAATILTLNYNFQ
jgi:cell division cycle protein 20 (cofactor of APC complex)